MAFPDLIRDQIPKARWIVSVSDNGWFGRSLASYQQLQMGQMLSLQTGRYQVVANKFGLSSIINDKGDILSSLPAFEPGILQSKLYPAQGMTPWVRWGDKPILIMGIILAIFGLLLKIK